MTNVLFDTQRHGQQVIIYKNGTIMIEKIGDAPGSFFIFDLDYLARLIGKAYKMLDQQEYLAELLGLTLPDHLAEPVVREEPLPLTRVHGVVFQGANGPEVLVDMIQELQDLTERNAQLRKQLETLEEIRSGLEGML